MFLQSADVTSDYHFCLANSPDMATKKKHTRFDSPKAALENYAIALQNLERCLWDNFGEAHLPVVAGISKGPDSDQFGVLLTVFLNWESICCH